MELALAASPETRVRHDRSSTETEPAEIRQLPPSGQPERASLERFIADGYLRSYGARIHHFAQQLVGLRCSGGPWLAGLGYTLADRVPLFVEQYLDQPVEKELADRLGLPIHREQVVEVGNLAASRAGAARQLIVCTTALLHRLDRTWVVFTSTRSLLNSFARLGIATIVLAQADPLRLPDRGSSWGSYYDTNPQVMTANIPLGFVHLLSAQRTASGVDPGQTATRCING